MPIKEVTGSNDQRLLLIFGWYLVPHGSGGKPMTVFVRVGAGLDLGTGVTRLSIHLRENATVADLLESLHAQYPNASRLDNAVVVSQGEHVSGSALLSDGQELALLLPISGGCK
jgi:molybdopterin synthase sulfur carrier subunit